MNLKERTNPLRERIKNLSENFNALSEKTLLSYQNAIFFIVVGDLFGIYYFLQWKVLGVAILILCLVFLGLIMWKLRDFDPPKKNKDEKWFKPKDKPEKPPRDDGHFQMSLDPENYNKRLEKAMGNLEFQYLFY